MSKNRNAKPINIDRDRKIFGIVLVATMILVAVGMVALVIAQIIHIMH